MEELRPEPRLKRARGHSATKTDVRRKTTFLGVKTVLKKFLDVFWVQLVSDFLRLLMLPVAAGGILVREGQELTSPKHSERLSTGALLEARVTWFCKDINGFGSKNVFRPMLASA